MNDTAAPRAARSEALNRRACPACTERYPLQEERRGSGETVAVHHLPNGATIVCEAK
jgi:hypothetical protein